MRREPSAFEQIAITLGGIWGFLLGTVFTYLLLFSGCATPAPEVFGEQDLIEQRLKFRAGHVGKLTYSVKGAGEASSGAGAPFQIRELDLRDAKVRERLNQLEFVCNVAGERMKPCLDEPGKARPGLCQITQVKECTFVFCKKKTVIAKYLDAVEDFEHLLQAGTRCFNKDRYPFEEAWMSRTRSFNSPSDFITAHQREATKEYLVYDVSGRLTDTYSTFWNAVHGDMALHTEYAYAGSSTQVVKRAESLTTWDSSWDI